jgi:hypothetical protein
VGIPGESDILACSYLSVGRVEVIKEGGEGSL